ncbi:MAG: MurR/RpiR family transcriptional regulator [Synergistaceae bacterium]|jgi:DNA-binding MurR/RpiR family transcriptional regulator|nr:MurR/RpiR family transcriptional regulator [Synergistaceae bacterium]
MDNYMEENGAPAAEHKDDVFFRLRRGMEELSSKQQVVCAYILENYHKTAFVTVEKLGGLCGASPATVVRTVKALGYGSYREMQREFEHILVGAKVSLWWELERSWQEKDDDFPFQWVAQDNIEAIKNCLTPQLVQNYGNAVDLLMRAKSIYILAMRSSYAASFFFYMMMKQMLPGILHAQFGSDILYDDLVDLGPEDVLFCLSLGGPHHVKTTANVIEFAARNSIPTILIANSPSTPAAVHATVTLYTPSTSRHYSLVACMTLLESLIVSIGRKKSEEARKKLRKLEKVLIEQNITL